MKSVFNNAHGEYVSMAKITVPKGKIVRRFGVNIYGNPKYNQLLQRRSHAPGQHGSNRPPRKVSDYALQLIEKQKLRYTYAISQIIYKALC